MVNGPVVLVLDDDPALRSLYGLLPGEGCTVIGAGTVAEAIALFREDQRINCLVLDWNLEGECGGQVYERLCGEIAERRAAVFLVSGNAHAIRRAAAMWRVQHLVKPDDIDLYTLSGKVAEAIAAARA